MHHPAHVDGRTLVILRRHSGPFGLKFSVKACGRLEFDGERLALVGPETQRVMTDDELASLMIVRLDTAIPECRGFDLFLIEADDV
jgi:hypothetical protein